jgi:two-component system cell cycle response regulator CtrA
MSKILLVDDDVKAASSLQIALLEHMKVSSDICDNIKDAYEMAKSTFYEIILLDLVFKKERIVAHDLIWKFRLAKIKSPIIVLSALWAIESKIRSLGFGADDYLVKPYNTVELIARIQALSRRFRGLDSSVYKIGQLSVHLDNKEVYCNNKPIILTGKEYAILEILVTRNGIVPKEVFLNNLYGGIDEPEMKIIDVFVCKLRKKLIAASGGIDFIQTVWGRGYQLNRNIKSSEGEGDSDSNGILTSNNSGNIFINHELDGLTDPSGYSDFNKADYRETVGMSGVI